MATVSKGLATATQPSWPPALLVPSEAPTLSLLLVRTVWRCTCHAVRAAGPPRAHDALHTSCKHPVHPPPLHPSNTCCGDECADSKAIAADENCREMLHGLSDVGDAPLQQWHAPEQHDTCSSPLMPPEHEIAPPDYYSVIGGGQMAGMHHRMFVHIHADTRTWRC
jgi:hypothetical protein